MAGNSLPNGSARGNGSGNNSFAYNGELYTTTSTGIIKYNPDSNLISQVTFYPLTAPKYIGYSVFLGDKVYCGTKPVCGNYYSEFYVYDLVAGSWTRLPDRPGTSYDTCVATTDNNKIMMLGENWAYQCFGWGDCERCSFLTNKTHYYDPNGNFWYDGPDFPDSNWGFLHTLTIDNTIYGIASHKIVGTGYGNVSPAPRLYKYTGTNWSYVTDVPLIWDYYSLTMVNYYGIIYIGAASGYRVAGRNYERWWIYDPDQNSWAEREESPPGAWQGSAGADTIGRYIYGFWGTDVWRYG
jgi:hypothetical protein